jgi:hypothetical protein
MNILQFKDVRISIAPFDSLIIARWHFQKQVNGGV